MDHPRSLLAESLWQILLPGLTMTIPLTGHAKLVIGVGAAWRLNRCRSPPPSLVKRKPSGRCSRHRLEGLSHMPSGQRKAGLKKAASALPAGLTSFCLCTTARMGGGSQVFRGSQGIHSSESPCRYDAPGIEP